MTAANELCDADMRRQANSDIGDTDETPEEQERFSFHDETDLDDIPPCLLSYFETSKSRAAVCEKLILEELEVCTASHYTEDTVNLPIELDKDMMKLNEQVICDTENEENNTSSDTRLLPAPTETEALFTHKVSVCPNNEDEAGTNKYTETEMHFAFDMRTLEISVDELERRKSNECEAEQEKQHCEEMKKEEQKRQIERDFQEELKKIMEAEKLRQRELELIEKRTQEKLEQEFLLQQELINSLQRQVEEERRRMEKEQKRLKDEEDKRNREEEKNKIEAERKQMEEETRRKKEEEKKRRKEREERQRIDLEKRKLEDEMRMMEEEKKKAKAEMKKEQEEKEKREEEKNKIEAERKQVEEEKRRKKEEERKIEEERKNKEEKRRMEREEMRKREEERNKIDLEKKKLEDEMKMMEEEKKKAEAERMKEQEEKGKREEERRKIEEARKEMEKRKMERGMSQKWSKKEEEERKKREEGNMRIEEEGRVIKETEQKKKQEKMRKKKEEEEADDRKRMAQEKICEEIRKRHKREHGIVDEEIKLEERKKKEAMGRKMSVEEEKEEARKREKEKERTKMEEKKNVKEVIRKQEDDNRKMKEEFIEENEKSKREDELKTKEGEQRRKQKEKSRRQMEEENYEKTEEEMRLKEEKERCYVDHRKMEYESKAKDEEKQLAEEKKKREERENVEAEKELNGQEVRENKEELYEKTEEDVRLIEKEENNKRMVKNTEAREGRANELKRDHNSVMAQNEKNNTDKTGNSSQLEDSTTRTSSSPGSLPAESAVCPTSTGAKPQQHNPDKTSIDETVDCEHQAARPSTISLFLPVWLPEHTEQKRLSWMNDCIPWSKLSLQNKRKQKGSVQSRRGLRRASEASGLQPLCSDALLQAAGWKSLQEITTVTLEDLPGCSLSTLAQCTQLRSLSLRRCGLKSLESISQLPQLCYIDVQENDISFVDCENMTSLRVLQLSHNKLTSIHGLAGTENLDVLDLSHNSITRIAGLESVRRLQRLSVEHNQLISTKGLRDIYTLLHLNCSHNHLASVEGLENSALLNTLDLRANSLTEPPSLNNQVLLRELLLDDNSISSLQGLTACWLPLMQHLSVAQNRITQLPPMSDSLSLENLDLRFNCMSDLQNVSESLQGCHFLREIHLTGNPLQQESGWRSTLQKAVPGLRAIDDQQTDPSLSPPAVQQVGLAPGSFLMFCQAQLQQTQDLQQRHSRELSRASSSVDAVEASCRHFAEALQLATDQRFAHEYGDTTVADKHGAAGQTTPETLDMSGTNAEKCTKGPETGSTAKVPSVIPNRDAGQSFITHHHIRCSSWTFDEKSAAERRHGDTFTTCPQTGPTVCKANFGSVHSLASKRKTIPSNHKMAPVSTHQDLDLKNAAAVVIQQLWRKCRQKCGNISSPSTAEKVGGRGGDRGKPESGPSYINGNVVGQDCAATVIQAFWRGCTVRRRLASALAAVTYPDSEEDDTFEEVDVDEFVLDEAALDKQWTLPPSEDSPPRHYTVSEQLQSLKEFQHPEPLLEPSQYILPPPLEWRSKQAWVAGEQVDSTGQRVSPVSCNRSKSPASASAASGLSERSERILEEWGFTHRHTALLMLKRAQKMRSKKQQQKKHQDPSVHLALFRNCSYQLGPVEARKRQTQHNRNALKVREAELGLQQAEKTERVKQERAQQWLHIQAAHFDGDSESVHFLPEISSDILNGGRVQLVADPGYAECLHHASGLWANSSLAAQPCKENNYLRRNSLGHAREEVPSLKPVTSALSKKERISFRDNPVQLSGGWGGGKKRNKYK